jgi:hypothetical protein
VAAIGISDLESPLVVALEVRVIDQLDVLQRLSPALERTIVQGLGLAEYNQAGTKTRAWLTKRTTTLSAAARECMRIFSEMQSLSGFTGRRSTRDRKTV